MATPDINSKPFDEGTTTKLDLFEAYAKEWLPVFLAGATIHYPEINIVDFCAGSGTDSEGAFGSSLRLLSVIDGQKQYLSRPDVKLKLFLSDSDDGKIARLRNAIDASPFAALSGQIHPDIKACTFADRLAELLPALRSKKSANLLIVDQYGIKEMPDSRFLEMTSLPTTDMMFFVTASTFHRFQNVPAIKRYLDVTRAETYNRALIAVCAAYQGLIPKDRNYYLTPFSIKKRSNIYGVLFGTAHRLGMVKFLNVAWTLDGVNGSANFDIEEEGIYGVADQLLPGLNIPKKVTYFEAECERLIRSGEIRDERGLLLLCFEHGITPQHAKPVMTKLRKSGEIKCNWWVPQVDEKNPPRSWTMCTQPRPSVPVS